ncbi:MAG: GNAT family N-acetyltransferase [Chloroflexi bacterium]|nr:GNAT family N-acetyltransferase [Chloroflexota bacterium]
MTPVTLHAISQVDFETFTTAFNLAYSDYYVSISMSVPTFRALIARDDLNLDASVAALDGNQIVGTGLLGIRGQQGWIGGMGVIPDRRRQGIGRQMMHYLLDRAREHGLTQVNLEVIEANTGAYALYRQLGFEDIRFLHCLDRDPAQLGDEMLPYQIELHPAGQLLAYYPDYHPIPNCWQRSGPSLMALAHHLHGWAVLDPAMGDGTIAGYAVGVANEYDVRLLDFAVNPTTDQRNVALALLMHLHRQFPAAHGTSYNIAAGDPVMPAYDRLGYITTFRQIEMQLFIR